MTSKARARLDIVLADVDTHIKQARTFTGGTRGAPAVVAGVSRPGRPFTRAATVLLAGAIEGYVEGVVEETGVALGLSAPQLRDLKNQIGRSHGANVHHVHQLTAAVGLPFVADTIGWNGLPSGGVRKLLGDLSSMRNKIAHGSAPEESRLAAVERWRKLSARFADELDKKCAQAVKKATGNTPW